MPASRLPPRAPQPASERRLATRFRVFYFLLFVPVGMQAPYLFLFLRRQGFSDAQLGTLASLTPLLNLLSPPLWGATADRFGDRRRTLALLLGVSGLLYPVLTQVHSFPAAVLAMGLFACFATAPIAIVDAIALENLGRAGRDYGRLRLWGSIGFAAPLVLFGYLLKGPAAGTAAGLHPTFVGYLMFRLLSLGWVALLPPSFAAARPRGLWSGARPILSPAFLGFALCGALQIAAMSAYYVYFTIYLDQLGVADHHKGYFWMLAVGAETALMLVVGRLIARIGLKWTFSLSLLGAALRLFAFSFALPVWAVAVLQLLHALTLTAFTVPAVMLIGRLTPPPLRASGQAVWVAATSGLGATLGSQLAGRAAAAWGLTGLFRAFSGIAAIGLVAVILLVREPPEPAVAPEEAAGRRNGPDRAPELPSSPDL